MDFLQTMCERLFANQLHQSVSASVDLRRPGTAGNMLRQSIAVNKVLSLDVSKHAATSSSAHFCNIIIMIYCNILQYIM